MPQEGRSSTHYGAANRGVARMHPKPLPVALATPPLTDLPLADLPLTDLPLADLPLTDLPLTADLPQGR